MEEKKESGMKKFAGAEELNMEELFEVTGGLTAEGRNLVKRRAMEYKRAGKSKEEFMHIFDNLSHLSLLKLETTRTDLLRYMDKTWETTTLSGIMIED